MCDDNFGDTAADAICRELGFDESISWSSNGNFLYGQNELSVTLDDIACETSEWSSCSYNSDHNCGHSEDVVLSCSSKLSQLISLTVGIFFE